MTSRSTLLFIALFAWPGMASAAEPSIRPSIEVFAQYGYRRTAVQGGGNTWFHAFDVPRAFVGVDAEKDAVHGRVLVEGVRSASEGALIGVAGDSLLVRFREAWGGARFANFFEARGGMLPTWFIGAVDEGTGTRVLLASALERAGFSSPADIGVQLRAKLPSGHGEVGVALFDGDGYEQRELNRGKSTELAATVRPLAPLPVLAPFAVLAGYVKGSVGTGSSRADRLVGGVQWLGDRIRAAVTFAYALGLQDDGSRKAWLLEGGLRVEPIDRLLLAMRGSIIARDSRESADVLRTLLLGAGLRVDDGIEAWVSALRSLPGSVFRDAIPSSDFTEARISGRFAF